jgi:hypothetical protein
MTDYQNAEWRWNHIDDYEPLTKEIMEQRLKALFGDWKFFVEVIACQLST